MSMALDDKQQDNDDHPQLPELAEPRSTAEVAEALQASGMVDELLAQIDSGQVQVTGDGGLIPGLIKLALERGLKAELTDHLGYEKGDPAGRELPNARNGSTPKTVASEAGPVELKVPRDRDGTFTPRLVPKGSRRLGGLDDIIISLYAGGMTLRDIQHHLAATVGICRMRRSPRSATRFATRSMNGRAGRWKRCIPSSISMPWWSRSKTVLTFEISTPT